MGLGRNCATFYRKFESLRMIHMDRQESIVIQLIGIVRGLEIIENVDFW